MQTPRASRVALVRHGRSSHVHAGWIDASGFRAWRQAYEAAGIRDDERPPAALEAWVDESTLVLSSDAPRALASAQRLAPGREIVVSPLLRELDLEGPDLGSLRLPLAAWAVGVGLRALLLSFRRRHPSAAEAARLQEAAAWLDGLAEKHPRIIAFTHASFRRQLSARLVQSGWEAEPGGRSLRPWSAWRLRRKPSGS